LGTLDGHHKTAVWDVESGKQEKEVPPRVPDSYLPTLKNATTDGRLILTLTNRGESLQVWDLEKGALAPGLGQRWRNYGNQPEPVLSPDGHLLAGVDYETYHLWVWDLETRKWLTSAM